MQISLLLHLRKTQSSVRKFSSCDLADFRNRSSIQYDCLTEARNGGEYDLKILCCQAIHSTHQFHFHSYLERVLDRASLATAACKALSVEGVRMYLCWESPRAVFVLSFFLFAAICVLSRLLPQNIIFCSNLRAIWLSPSKPEYNKCVAHFRCVCVCNILLCSIFLASASKIS